MAIISIFLVSLPSAESLEGWKQAFLRPCHFDRQMYQLAIGPSQVAYGHELHISILRVYGIASPESLRWHDIYPCHPDVC